MAALRLWELIWLNQIHIQIYVVVDQAYILIYHVVDMLVHTDCCQVW